MPSNSPIKSAKTPSRRSNFVAGRKASARRKTNQSAFVLAVTQGVDDAVGYRDWLFAIANKMTDTNRRSDATPAVRLPIDRNKQVSWEQRRLDSLDAAGMTTLLDVPGKVKSRNLDRFVFALLSACGWVCTTCQRWAITVLIVRPHPLPKARCSRLGTMTRSAPNRATAALMVAWVEPRSVTINPSIRSATTS